MLHNPGRGAVTAPLFDDKKTTNVKNKPQNNANNVKNYPKISANNVKLSHQISANNVKFIIFAHDY